MVQEEETSRDERAESYAGIHVEITSSDMEENIKHRDRAYIASRLSVSKLEYDSEDFGNSSDSKTMSMFCKSSESERVVLEDFQILNVIGKGNFGKVYLVYLPSRNMFYAMKSIRKDIVLDSDSLENIKLEKLILL